MRIPKTPIEFDYDLWTTEDGKCMVRVKATKEECEVSREAFRLLRAEEKRLRRSYSTSQSKEDTDEESQSSELSLDALPDDEVKSAAWLADPHDFEKDLMMKLLEEEFQTRLTTREAAVYKFCIRDGGDQASYAALSGLSISRVCRIVAAIRKKAKNFF